MLQASERTCAARYKTRYFIPPSTGKPARCYTSGGIIARIYTLQHSCLIVANCSSRPQSFEINSM
jgi:hypothetical protein